ncbi:MAG: hypothetical protein WDZ61_00465 [Parcubacteria group bacterium]
MAEVKQDKPITRQQMKALHVLFDMMAQTLNQYGLTQRKVLEKAHYDVWWNKDNFKDAVWRPMQKSVVKKDSTKELLNSELNETYEIMTRFFSETFGVYVEFPSIESIVQRLQIEEQEKNNSKASNEKAKK